MKPIFYLGIMLALLILISIPSSTAWNSKVGDTHDKIASTLYHTTPPNIRTHLDLNEMEKGARWPDYNGESKKWHGYPYSNSRVHEYLTKAKIAYQKKDYKNESLYYGVVSHYISDTYAAPHTVGRLSYHYTYYNQADGMNIHIYTIKYTNLNSILKYGYVQGRKSAAVWEKRKLWNEKRPPLVQADLNRAASATFAVYKKWMGF